MRRLRTLSTRRLAAIVVAVAALAVTAAVAQAGLGSDPKPQPKALDQAITDALNAPARRASAPGSTFTNTLIQSGSRPTAAAAAAEGSERPDLDRPRRPHAARAADRGGDAQIVSDGERLTAL